MCKVCGNQWDREVTLVSDITLPAKDGKQTFSELLDSFSNLESELFCQSCRRLTTHRITANVRFLPGTRCFVVRVLLNSVDDRCMLRRSITDFRAAQSVTMFRNQFLLLAAVLHHETKRIKVITRAWSEFRAKGGGTSMTILF